MVDDRIEDTVDERSAPRSAVGIGNLDIFVEAYGKGYRGEIHDFGKGSDHDDNVHEREAFGIPAVAVDEGVNEFAICLIVLDCKLEKLATEAAVLIILELREERAEDITLTDTTDCLEDESADDMEVVVPVHGLGFESVSEFVTLKDDGLVDLSPEIGILFKSRFTLAAHVFLI